MDKTSAPTTPFEVHKVEPSQEDRLLAAAGYLGYFTGFWLVVPILIYVLKREKSRFVAHHAMRAVLLHLLAVPLGIVCGVVSMAIGIATMVAIQPHGGGRGDESAMAGLFALFVWGSWIFPFLVYFVVTVLASIAAFQGRVNTTSMFGRLSEWALKQDKSVAPQT